MQSCDSTPPEAPSPERLTPSRSTATRIRLAGLILALAVVVGVGAPAIRAQQATGDPTAPAAAQGDETPVEAPALVPATSLACAVVAGLPETVERTKYCVHYNHSSVTDAQAEDAADWVQLYWDRFVALGFNEPKYSGKLEVRLSDIPGSCNGATGWSLNYITTYAGCFAFGDVMVRAVLGHELTHRVQYAHDSGVAAPHQTKMLKEGTARATEDNWFNDVDDRPDGMTAPFSFNNEVNDYFASMNNDITSIGMRYESALFWKYASEQFGVNPTDPELGIDFFLALYNETFNTNGITAINNTLASLGAGTDFDGAFRQFAVANWAKDLTGVPDASYNYVDEDEAGNPGPYGPIAPTNGGTITSVSSANWGTQAIARYGLRYYEATPDAADCPVITASFAQVAGSTAFYHVITQNGGAFNTHVEGSGADWSQSFLNDGITKVVAIAGAQNSAATVDLSLACVDPVIDIELPTTLAPAYVGSSGSPDDIVVQVSVTDGSPTGPVVAGIVNSDFKAEVGGLPALVLGGGFVQEEYFLLIDTPVQAANGPYELEIFLEEPGTTNVIASDSEADAVIYDNTNTDLVIVTDVSGSMWSDDKLKAAQDAANLFVDASNSSDGLGLVSYNHDVVSTLSIQFGTLPHRNDAHTEINGYIASGATSIGDGLDEAVSQRAASVTGNARCQFTLLSDGMENSAQFWTDVQAAVVATGCPVMTVAFGEASNETLMQDIATATGGAAYFNDVFVSSPLAPDSNTTNPMALELANTYLYSLCEAQGCERIYNVEGTLVKYLEIVVHEMTVDDSLDDLTIVLDWNPYIFNPQAQAQGGLGDIVMEVTAPDGTIYKASAYDFLDTNAGHAGFQIDDPQPGLWYIALVHANEIAHSYQVHAYGQTDISLELIVPDLDGATTGDYMPLYAIWEPSGYVTSYVTAPNGSVTILPLYDDGQHGDGAADDGFYAGLYTLVTQAPAVTPEEEGQNEPGQPQGAYVVDLLATAGDVTREARGAFAVEGGADGDGDSVPDIFVDTHCPGAPNSDADLDKLSCADEYFVGTDPNNSDTDGGGESDESEAIRHGLDPFAPADDVIEAPAEVVALPQNGSVLLGYDVKPSYQTMLAYRATSPGGPWVLVNAELPLTGSWEDGGAVNGQTYYYCVQGIDGADHWTAVVCSSPATPAVDPTPPEAVAILNGAAPSTDSPDVILSTIAVGEVEEDGLGPSGLDDIADMMVSNSPLFVGATWQPFQPDLPWQLLPGSGLRTVYVRYRDAAGNESVGVETATIMLEADGLIFIPMVARQ